MEQATQKQVNFLLTLNNDLKESELKELSKIEASKLIRKLLKDGKNEKKEETGACNLNKINYDELYKKYNAYSIDTTNSNYNDINGANSKSPLLRDSRAFKKYISDIIKKEFKGVKFKISCSFAGYNDYCDIVLYFDDPFLNYKDIETFNPLYNLLGDFNISIKEHNKKYIYNNYCKIRGLTERENASSLKCMYDFLKPDVKKLYDFLKALLNSYGYDHNDIMTDYFDSGLDGNISIYDLNTTEEEREQAWENCQNSTEEERMEKGQATEEEKQEQARKHAELLKKLEEEAKAREEERRKAEEIAKKHNQEKEKLLNDPNAYEVQTVAEDSMIIEHARFSNWNKPCNFDEACEYVKDHPECKGVGTLAHVCKIVNFKNQDLFNLFKNNTLDCWQFLSGGGCCWVKKEYNKYIDVSDEEEHEIYYSKKTMIEHAKDGYYWMRACILIQFKNKNMFLVDPSGYTYCRYIGLLPEEKGE